MTNFEKWLRAFRKDRKRKITKRVKSEYLGLRLCDLFICTECPAYGIRRRNMACSQNECARHLGMWAMKEAEE